MANNQAQIAENRAQVAVVIVPFPAQGHLNPLLHLSRRVSVYNIPVYYVGAAIHIRQAKARAHGWDPSAVTNLHFHEFPTPELSPESGKYHSHLPPLTIATLPKFYDVLVKLVDKLSSRNVQRVVVIFDSAMASVVQAIQSLPNVECYCFETPSAFSLYSLYWEVAGKPDHIPTEAAEILKQLPSIEECFSPELHEFVKSQFEATNFHSGTIYNTSRIVDSVYLDLLAKRSIHGPDKHWAVGPLNPVFGHEKEELESRSKCLEWLDKQPQNSVIFVSFGTSSSLSEEQIRELAIGLERSEQKFIWALRDADKGDVFYGEVMLSELPEGFEERVEERGIVVRDWAPQLEILKHRATGGFMSHCGWNSCIESISMGVPIATWPMKWDQPKNSVLITKVLKIGVEVREWARRDELVSSVTVEEAVRRLMASAEGDEIRQRAEQLADSIGQSMVEGGAAHLEMDSFIAHIIR